MSAIGDEIASAIDAALSVVLIGERPGLSSPDSLGIYLTWNPRPGRLNSERNCISNVHGGGLSPGVAARLLAVLMRESRARRLSGINLKASSLDSLPPEALRLISPGRAMWNILWRRSTQWKRYRWSWTKSFSPRPDIAARRQHVNRSALVRQALERHLKHLKELELEERDRRGYLARPQREEEDLGWETSASWPRR